MENYQYEDFGNISYVNAAIPFSIYLKQIFNNILIEDQITD